MLYLIVEGGVDVKLYAIRHGLTVSNIQGVYNGLIDEDINDIGIRQVEESRELVSNIDYAIVYSSPILGQGIPVKVNTKKYQLRMMRVYVKELWENWMAMF